MVLTILANFGQMYQSKISLAKLTKDARTIEEWQAMLSIKFVSDEVRGLGHFSTEFHQSHQKYKRACSMSTKLILQAS